MRSGILAAAALAVLLLSGCSPSVVGGDPDDVLMTSTVDMKSTPGFLAGEQGEEDVLSVIDADDAFIDPASTRYQGEWEGGDHLPDSGGRYDVYLGVGPNNNIVQVITVSVEHPELWGYGSSLGNSVLGLGDPMTLQYLPQGSSAAPEGWHALSDWIIVKD